MKFRLIPRNESFFPLFDESAQNVRSGAGKLREMIANRLGDAQAAMEEIKVIEKHGDECTRAIVVKVQNSFVTPFDREDIHELAEGLDDILDEILNVADIVVLHNVVEEQEHLLQLADVLVESCDRVAVMIAKLSSLHGIEEDFDAINQHRRDARKIYRESVSLLFSGEFKSFEVLKLKDLNESLREAVKQTDRVADIVEAITLKHT